MRVLLVEDNEVVAELVKAGFDGMGWQVDVATSGKDAEHFLSTVPYDAAVLDIELPDTNGYTILEAIRKRPTVMPVIMLTARGGPEAVVKGLVAGADDYVTKPFDMSELTARILAVLRRTTSTSQEVLQFGDLSFNRLTRETACKGKRVRLTPKEQTFLEQLMMTPGASVSREELLQTVWRINFDPGSNLLDTHVARLRSKLKQIKCDVAIVTRRGEGFALELSPEQSIPGRP